MASCGRLLIGPVCADSHIGSITPNRVRVLRPHKMSSSRRPGLEAFLAHGLFDDIHLAAQNTDSRPSISLRRLK
jgi:hypothetical protein